MKLDFVNHFASTSEQPSCVNAVHSIAGSTRFFAVVKVYAKISDRTLPSRTAHHAGDPVRGQGSSNPALE